MSRSATWPMWGKPCAACGNPVHPPTTVHMKAANIVGNRIWHGACFPPEGVVEIFTTSSAPPGVGDGK